MALPIGLIAAIGVLAVILIVTGLGARGRGTLIECPECGNQFKRPAFSQRKYGVGIGLGSFGEYTCPKCNYKGSVSSFSKAESTTVDKKAFDDSDSGSGETTKPK